MERHTSVKCPSVEQIRISQLQHRFPRILGNDDLVLNKNASSILAGSFLTFVFSEICMGRFFPKPLFTIRGIYFSSVHSELFFADINLPIFRHHGPERRIVLYYCFRKMSLCAIQMSWLLVFTQRCSK